VAVGEILHEDTRKVMCGPRSAVESQSEKVVILRPGQVKKDQIAKDLSQLFNVPVDEMNRILPPGDSDVVK
ncbi:MAG: fibronectin-binding domain-containing protein, partial [Thermoplasmata archaeon]|nr:fibronectin-binding domain-containing protein [Thermoplasmata archaeon]